MWNHFLFLLGLQLCTYTDARIGYNKKVPIPAGGRAQYHIQTKDSYKFGYDTGIGASQSFREETRDPDGTVRGRYGFIDPLGTLRIVDYMADSTGFHVLSSLKLTAETPSTTPKPRTTLPPPTRPPRDPVYLPFVGPLPPFLPRINR